MLTVITEVPSPEATDQMYVETMGIPMGVVHMIRISERNDPERVLFECLCRWRNKIECNGGNAEKELPKLLKRLRAMERLRKHTVCIFYHINLFCLYHRITQNFGLPC